MSIMVLNDKTEHYLTDEQTQKVEQALAKSADGFISVAGVTVKKSVIQQIKPGGKTQADIFSDPWADEAHMLEDEKKCFGTNSIQNEINNIARSLDHKADDPNNPKGLGWAKLITDKKWRANIRSQLLEKAPDGWCDDKGGSCVCHE